MSVARSSGLSDERGTALIVALLLAAILSTLAVSAFMSSFTGSIVSAHHAARVDAVATAEGTVELVTPWLAYDFQNDPQGWSNAIFLVPEPSGSTPKGLKQDSDGSVTGVNGAWYFDLRDANGDGIPDRTVPSLEPYEVPAALAGAMIDPQLFPDARVRISLRNLTSNSAPGGGSAISYRSRGVGLRIEGESARRIAGMLDNEGRAVIDGVDITFGASIDSFWRNAIYGVSKHGVKLEDVTVHGSVHAVAEGNLPDKKGKIPNTFETALELKNGASILNHYVGLDSALASVLTTRNDGSADAEVRAYGPIEIDSSTSTVGQASGAAPAGAKGPIETIFSIGGFSGSYAEQHWEDEIEEYTGMPGSMLEISKEAYTDPASSIEYEDYFDFLRGSAEGPGANALDISFFGKHGGKNGNVSFSRASLAYERQDSVAYDLYNRFYSFQTFAFENAPVGTTLDVFIELEDGSSTLKSYNSPLGYTKNQKIDSEYDGTDSCAPGYVDVYGTDDDNSGIDDKKYEGMDPGCALPTGVFGAVKTIPVGSANYPLPQGAVHGLVYIPPDIAVDAVGAVYVQNLLDKISAALPVPVPSPLDPVTGGINAVGHGRLYGVGLFMAHRIYFNRLRDDKDSESYTPLRYAGRMTFFTIHDIEITGQVLPMRSFACPDALGIIAAKKVEVVKDVPATLAAAFYGREIKIEDGTHFGGTIAAYDKYTIGTDVHVAAAVDLPECVPPFLPDDPSFRMQLRGWSGSR